MSSPPRLFAKLFPRTPTRRRRLIWRWIERRQQRRQEQQQRHRRVPGSGSSAFALIFRIAPSTLVFSGPSTSRADLMPLALLCASTGSPSSRSTRPALPASPRRGDCP